MDPLNQYATFAFDGAGNTTKRTDARGQVTSYTMDALNRVVTVLYNDGSRVSRTYDAVGRQLSMGDATGVTTFTWDARSMKTAVTNPNGRALSYSFDPAGNRLWMQDQDGKYVSYSWDAENRVSQIVNQANEYTTISYDRLDRTQKVQLSNGIVTSRTYDAAGRQTLIEHRTSAGVGKSVYTATYDVVGNRLTQQEIDGVIVTYSYDASNQLTREQRSGAQAYDYTYTYDGAGNRLSKNSSGSVTNNTFDAANEQTLSTPQAGAPTTSTYDRNGNLALENTGGALTTYTWDGENRFTRVDNSDGTNEQYTYAADNLRRKKVSGATTTIFVMDEQNVSMETDGAAATQAIYVDLPGIWGGKFSQRRNTTSSMYLPDFQGNMRQLADISQAISDTLVPDAWGVELATTGATVHPFGPFGLWGYFRDTQKRLYVRRRHLQPQSGTWLSRDPIPATSLYAYAQNEPVSRIDPEGLRCEISNIKTSWKPLWCKTDVIDVGPPCMCRIRINYRWLLDFDYDMSVTSHNACYLAQWKSHGGPYVPDIGIPAPEQYFSCKPVKGAKKPHGHCHEHDDPGLHQEISVDCVKSTTLKGVAKYIACICDGGEQAAPKPVKCFKFSYSFTVPEACSPYCETGDSGPISLDEVGAVIRLSDICLFT